MAGQANEQSRTRKDRGDENRAASRAVAAHDQMAKEAVDPRLFIAGVGKTFAVLKAFYNQHAPLSLTEIAGRTGIGRSAAQRFVYTLKTLGYLHQDPQTKRYTLTPKVVDFAHAYLRNDPLLERAFPYLLEASKQTDETVNLTRLDGAEVIFLSRFPSRNVISADLVIGSRLPAFCTSPGRAMLAHLDEREARHLLTTFPREARTEHTITDLALILQRLETVRRNGFETALQESFYGDLSVAAPVFGYKGEVIAAVNIAVPTPRWSAESLVDKLAPVVIETARAISGALKSKAP
ncbi:MAG: IclR family transcriptional regulator C-terminal domain-containing protein [Kiloniellaceae bacterium]